MRSSCLYRVDGGRLTLRSLELRNGHTTGNGGALSLLNGAFVEIINCVVSDSSAVNGDGAAVDSGSVLAMIGSSLVGNRASIVKCLRQVLLFKTLTSFSLQRIIDGNNTATVSSPAFALASGLVVGSPSDQSTLGRCERETSL